MRIDTTEIQAEVYAENSDKKIMYVKITVPSLRMYINSCTVRPSTRYGDMWFQMPAFLTNKKWVKPIEFSGDSELFDLFRDAALRAADQYIQDKKFSDSFPGATQVSQQEAQNVPF